MYNSDAPLHTATIEQLPSTGLDAKLGPWAHEASRASDGAALFTRNAGYGRAAWKGALLHADGRVECLGRVPNVRTKAWLLTPDGADAANYGRY